MPGDRLDLASHASENGAQRDQNPRQAPLAARESPGAQFQAIFGPVFRGFAVEIRLAVKDAVKNKRAQRMAIPGM